MAAQLLPKIGKVTGTSESAGHLMAAQLLLKISLRVK
jgi:hypothetical protein